jgi:glycosyltransferase involved in cell wall biosynthesis
MINKIKVLLISPFYPFPEYANGVNKINYNLLNDNDIYTVDILSLVNEEDTSYYKEEKKFNNSKFYKLDFKQENKYKILLKWFFTVTPFNLLKYRKANDIIVDKLLNIENKYDIIHISAPHLMPIVDKLPDSLLKKIILFPIDSFSLFTKRRIENESNILKKIIYKIDYLKLEKLEISVYEKISNIYFVSDVDAKYINIINPELHTKFIPNGVDIDYFKELNLEKENNSIIFTGNMSYAPNKDACNFLINDIVPIVKEKIPDIKVYIVGINADKEFSHIQDNNNIIKGYVDDIRLYIDKASLYISPLRFGSGIKNKILEAMSMSKSVIGTQISFDGIRCDENSCFLVEYDKNKFANKIIELLLNPKQNVGINARELIEKEYSWKHIQNKYGEVYENRISNE